MAGESHLDPCPELGARRPEAPPALQTGSWAFSILPYVEQDNVFRAWDQGAGIPLYLCPSRGRTPALPVPPSDPVSPWVTFDSGGLDPWSTTDYAGNGYLLVNRWPAGASRWPARPCGSPP